MFFVQTGFDCSKILLQFWGSQNCISFPVSAFSGFRSDFWGSKNFEIHTNHANLPEKWLNFGRVKNPMERGSTKIGKTFPRSSVYRHVFFLGGGRGRRAEYYRKGVWGWSVTPWERRGKWDANCFWRRKLLEVLKWNEIWMDEIWMVKKLFKTYLADVRWKTASSLLSVLFDQTKWSRLVMEGSGDACCRWRSLGKCFWSCSVAAFVTRSF